MKKFAIPMVIVLAGLCLAFSWPWSSKKESIEQKSQVVKKFPKADELYQRLKKVYDSRFQKFWIVTDYRIDEKKLQLIKAAQPTCPAGQQRFFQYKPEPWTDTEGYCGVLTVGLATIRSLEAMFVWKRRSRKT